MLNKNNTFKTYEELSEEEKKLAHKIAKFALVDAQRNNLPTSQFLFDNVGKISKGADISTEELPELILKIHALAMQLSFRKEIKPVGFHS